MGGDGVGSSAEDVLPEMRSSSLRRRDSRREIVSAAIIVSLSWSSIIML